MIHPRVHQASSLAKLIDPRIREPGDIQTSIPGLALFRRDQPVPPATCLVEPSLILVARGAKQLWIGGEAYSYDPSHFLVTSLDLPANGQVLVASPEQPCVGLVLKLDVTLLTEVIAAGVTPAPQARAAGTGVGIGRLSPVLEGALARLLEMLDEPQAIPVLAPLVLREIHYRLLHSDQAARLRQIAAVDGQGYRIAKAIDWLKLNYTAPLRIEELAARVQMSAPTFHHHFRQLTAMSPLQYQKWLRLNEARRLMLSERLEVSRAAFAVGYESPSQFSREYSRLFGAAPRLDIAQRRGQRVDESSLDSETA
ncbi:MULTISPECIES: AraC family transcriptional regulator [unclassified Pseudomonas]|uniref:AraC family transcriptional regulator n=1 Tax=unclassified Pseudomonas TaxID=196821 RepID=UPI000D39D4ED|nr:MULTISPECIES: AraC family transcriptional regulator [unclassified Pseudomonas]RAU44104.1 AraC family transcriptional regulator [Pseudomonas sp. RIT 409]RAU54849.1 AraC family transcriptional regulator [Pseudomonas sp. RIT 412]